MSHPDEGILQELLDGELPPADAAAVRAHLAGCVPCAVILRDLGATQAEADAIVARLPLDPPLVPPAARAGRRGPMNLRLLGLAASALLVAGTSWVLLRSPSEPMLSGRTERDDSAAGVVLPFPGQEREASKDVAPVTQAPGTLTPAPTAAAGADANAAPGAKAKQVAPREAQADQPVPERAAMPAAEKKEAPAMAPAMAPAARLAAGGAPKPGSTVSVADAEARLGTKLRTISGLTPLAVEALPLSTDSSPGIRQVYLVSGVPVVLVQRAASSASRDEVTSKRDAALYVDGVAAQPGNRGNGFIAAGDSAGGPPVTRTWEAWGSLFELRGALPTDSIDALMKRVK